MSVLNMTKRLMASKAFVMSCISLTAFAMQPVQAQSYPNKPIKFIAPIAPGGLTDTLTREIATGLSAKLGQPVVVDNRPGGGGTIGMVAAAKSPADGYTIVMVYAGVASVNPVLIPDLPYNTLRDFAPISLAGGFPLALIARESLPVNNTKELIEYAKNNPGKLNYASAGNATSSHITMELFLKSAGISMAHIPYKGEKPVLNDLMGGQVDVAFNSLTSVLPLMQSGKIKVLGISTPKASPLAPHIQPISEAGVPGFHSTGWYGILAPAGTPAEIIQRLSKETQTVLNDPAFKERLAKQGVDLYGSTPEDAKKWIEQDTEKWRKVILEAGIKAN